MASMHGVPPPNGAQWNDVQYASDGSYGVTSQNDTSAPGGMGYVKGFAGAGPQKMTRDGQPAKRRGPKPDSRPAQTRRQELNRQAQRTHRERKEQYIKSLEFEISGLREGYASDVTRLNTTLQQHKEALRQHQEENSILIDILRAHGISYQGELESRKAQLAAMNAQTQSYPQSNPALSQGAMSHTGSYHTITPTRTTAAALTPSPGLTDRSFGTISNSMSSNITPSTSGTSYHSQSPSNIAASERGIKQEDSGVSQFPGVFEQEPQLGIDFILALEHTCREHEEYLVRRSIDSPDDPEEALFSGHALMASCPPPSHIKATPAQQGGLQPTYPHQAPQIPYENLMTLLNLSRRMVEQGDIEGGQITPIMALQHLRSHRLYSTLTKEDVHGMIDVLNSKVRCYGFGAVMEDFELIDTLATVFSTKGDLYSEVYGGVNAEDDDMYS